MNTTPITTLEFDPERNELGKDKRLRDGLSVAVQIGNTLWVANDETVSLERLSLLDDSQGTCRYGRHKQFPLNDYLALPVPPPDDPADLEEADVEGLACAGGYLWLVGSHSLKRKNPKLKDGPYKARKQLATVGRDGNRYLLARIPILESEGTCTLAKQSAQDGKKLFAACLRGDDKGNELTEALQKDEHLEPFLAIPGKDNGFDIEGLAVVGERVFLGLRGPVLRGWAVVLEVAVKEDKEQPSTLRLRAIGPNGRRYRKHFLQLGGLGIRDLCVQGSDLLILAGPTMDLDGPVSIFRWLGGSAPDGEALVPAGELQRVLEVPYGDGVDHAEGMTLFAPDGDPANSLLVVYDAAAERRKSGRSTVTADIFMLSPDY
ncbi:DUF3616 domain-containing protein [Azotobacter beijerinckii]|uniref:DUF3616 domain-containing protein n=1 Tax=Azotobacter beijerinckii TaxID=170623 RepID=A0A1I4D136_9GAMM|nr:DUF3616 domain-containing protein [Azotobacter beijerinckii]SFB28607.1 Protein of unknown function [Azotobacter beijerinckii]SFK86713.1 Protein of unknown function [Azotobacter beijerinckii]